MDFRYMQTDNARISKPAIKELKKPTLANESWENKNKVSKNPWMVLKSEVANTKEAENPRAQAI